MSDIVSKHCAKCKQDKPETDFSRTRGATRQPFCKTCLSQKQKAGYTAIHPPTTPDGYKQCPHCRQTFASTAEFFYSNKSRSDGLSLLCKICHCEYEQARHSKPKITPPEEITCYECGQTKPAIAFAKKRAAINGIDTMCRDCRTAERMGYYYGNEQVRANILAACKAYRINHREKIRVRKRAWEQANKERQNAYKRSYRQREHVRSRRRVEARNRHARKLQASGTHTKQDIQKQYERQKGRCYWCNVKLSKGKRQVHVDHIVPLSRGGTNWPDNLVIACHACNESKNNRLPHEWPQGGRLM